MRDQDDERFRADVNYAIALLGISDIEAGKLQTVSAPTITRWRTGEYLPSGGR